MKAYEERAIYVTLLLCDVVNSFICINIVYSWIHIGAKYEQFYREGASDFKFDM